ncbi:hypothetical protein KKF60_03160 [Patescibacteria group bacterium]|nr:hypothetical protein [Patescibacteria group bacterium]MBU4458866.1 hypothetical protein [Patescibacteria group bacterium]MCG2696151.1 hypothetical protein [Candidatus Portnoybacteria bacterium]MCG2762399.1 hypothetical protein [Candidatus Atribacteria bacterium]
MKKTNNKRLEEMFDPDICTLNTDAVISDGSAIPILSTNPPLIQNISFPVKIITREGKFWIAKMENGEIISIELC